MAALVTLVDEARHSGEDSAQHKVAQLADTGSAGTLDDDVEQVLHEADGHAVHRAEGERAQQGGQVGEVHLDEGRDEHRQRELDEHQDKGDRAEHGGNGQVVGGILFHGSCPPRGVRPVQICSESPFRAGSNRKDKPKNALLQPKTATGRTDAICLPFLASGLYRWSRSCTGSAPLRVVADFTASGELHPALKRTF